MKTILSTLVLLVLTAVSADAVQDLESAESAFRSAAVSGTKSKRTSALNALIALGDPDAVPTLTTEYARVSVIVRDARDDAYRAKYAFERVSDLIKSMELRAERDPGLKQPISRQREKQRKFQEEMESAFEKVASNTPWRDEIGDGVRRLFEAIPKKRKKAEGAIWDSAEEEEQLEVRLASIELLGVVGGDGSASRLQKLLFSELASQAKIKRSLRKEEAEIRKMEARLQEENRRQGKDQPDDRKLTGAPSTPQYNKLVENSRKLNKELTLRSFICDACVEAGGAALARESGSVLDKSIASLLRSMKKSKGGGYVRVLTMLGYARTEPVQSRLRKFLAEEKEPLGKATVLDALAAAGDEEIVDPIIETFLKDESWHVRSRAAAALAVLRVKRGIPALIAQLEAEQEGRVRTDISHALQSLSAKDFRTNATLWQRWWKDVGATFEVPPLDAETESSEHAEDTVGVTFFGIRTESQRVLFVLDLSASMNFSMVPRDNPDDDLGGGRAPDWPEEGEVSRLNAAKRDLQKAMGGLQDDALFNVIFYASDVWTWQNKLVKMDKDTRSDVTEVIEDLIANGATNLYGAMKLAMEMAGAGKEGDEWTEPEIDTIYLLSDGRPSVGASTDPDEIIDMVSSMNKNAGITIHTIGLSGAQDAYLLRSLAEKNGGTYAAR